MMHWQEAQFRELRSKSVHWFRRHGRNLPWRDTRDPYAIWISEIMLQQTQVATVLPYFDRFLRSYPDIASLAAAQLEDVYHHWAGLGYYRRARQLHAAAQRIIANFGGEFPREYESIRTLEGIGRYTAGAILSFAFDDSYPIVEANTQRLYSRLLLLKENPTTARAQTALWDFAQQLLPQKKGAGLINQALMEIGSQICLPKSPKCDVCPLADLCPTKKKQLQDKIPPPKVKKAYVALREAALLISDKTGRVLMRRCAPKERWAGLWDFPRFDITGYCDPEEIKKHVAKQFSNIYGASVVIDEERYRVNHCVTKYRITLQCFDAKVRKISLPKLQAAQAQWITKSQVLALPLNASCKKVWMWFQNESSSKIAGR